MKAAGLDTAGRFGLVETAIPRGHSAPLHIHHEEDEAFYVLTGVVDFVCEGERSRAERGSFVYLPRGMPHSFLGVSDEAARVLVLMVPAGLEQAFGDPERFGEVFERRNVEIVGPPLAG